MKNITPKSLTIITMYTCTSTCKNCCFSCSPKRKERLSLNDIKEVIRESIDKFPTIEIIVFTGGEAFILQEELLDAVKYASHLHRLTRIVSNAYWAKSYKQAYKVLRELKKNGLNEINYSTGDEHQEFVPYENIVYACRAALDLSLTVAVNIEAHESKEFKIATLSNDIRLTKYKNSPSFFISNGQWIIYDENAKKAYQKKDNALNHFTIQKEKGCETLFNNITISPEKQLFSCCGFFAPKTPFLQFGRFGEGDILELYNQQFDDLLKIWLYVLGPHDIAKFINSYKYKGKIEYSGKHPCCVCEEIYSDPQNIEIIKQHYQTVFPQIIFAYEYEKLINQKFK